VQAYRDEHLSLEQLSAFAVSDDQARQEQVYEALSWNRSPQIIRRALTEHHVATTDRRALFVGVDAYRTAGGEVLRDLFTEDEGGWLTDPALLDRLALDRLNDLAEEVRQRERWLWAEAFVEFPHGHGLRRVYPHAVVRTTEHQAEITRLEAAYEALLAPWETVEDVPDDVAAQLREIDATLTGFGDGYAYDEEDHRRAGLFVALDYQGEPRIERGFVRPQDEVEVDDLEPAAEEVQGTTTKASGDQTEEDGAHTSRALSDRLVADLTAHRTAALRDALADQPAVAFLAVIHALVLRLFFASDALATCLDVRASCESLDRSAPGIGESPAGIRIAQRHATWAKRLPRTANDVWGWLLDMDGLDRAALMAHCSGLTVNAVQSWERRGDALDHADQLARAIDLDMADYWRADADTYFGRVTKARILEAVRGAVGEEAARNLETLKKADMAASAAALLRDTRWLPAVLITPVEPLISEPQAEPTNPLAAE
jgi:ParB family chromosome partitioning protein